MLRTHAEEGEKRWGCEVCEKRYGVEIDLKNHRIKKWQSSLCKHEDKCDGVWAN